MQNTFLSPFPGNLADEFHGLPPAGLRFHTRLEDHLPGCICENLTKGESYDHQLST